MAARGAVGEHRPLAHLVGRLGHSFNIIAGSIRHRFELKHLSNSRQTRPTLIMIHSSQETLEKRPSLFNLPSQDRVLEIGTAYGNANPFPHTVLDNFLVSELHPQHVKYPELSWAGWSQFHDGYQYGKRVCNELDLFPAMLRELTIEACQPRFLNFLEDLTQIRGLIPDPYLNGGGLHSSGEPSILAPHTDFHIYDKLGLYRRLNLLVYFNSEWADGDGGALELSKKGSPTPTASILPIFGRAVIFNTDDISVHGFTKPVASGKRRNSLALYYYTANEVGVFSGDRTTHWQQHGSSSGLRGARISVYKGLLLGSRMSKLAHMANPNKGSVVHTGITPER